MPPTVRRPLAPAAVAVCAAVLALALALVLAACSGSGPATPAADAPAAIDALTVLVVSIDTLRADRVGAYGKADAGTPAMDRVAAAGVRFTNAQSTAPLTLPAHASLLTGRSLPAHGVFDNGTFALPDTLPTLGEQFTKAGFATAAFVSSPVLARRYGLARGFSIYDDRIPPSQTIIRHGGERAGRETTDAALVWLSGLGKAPAFLWVHYFEPHRPYAPPPEFARQDGDNYQGEVATADAALARLVDGIGRLGRGGKLLVAVVADHGEGLGEHGEQTHGTYLYRGTMAIPFLLSGPAFGVKPAVIDAPVSIADLAPTLLELAGAAPLSAADGMSLAAAARGQGTLPADRGVFAESHVPQIEFGWSGLRAIVRGGHKYIDAPRPELYALTDAAEARDLSKSDAARARDEAEALDALVKRGAALGPEHAAAAMTAEQSEALRGLGYMASGAPRDPNTALVDRHATDPKDRAEFMLRFDEALAMVRMNDTAQALPVFRELLKTEPKNHGLLFEYGQALIMAKQLDEALAAYRTLVAAHPGSGAGWYRLGQLYDHRREVKEAEACYRRAMQTDPYNTDPIKALASLIAENGRVDAALELLEKGRRLDPADPSIERELQRLRRRP